jgi:hypothetical protein
VLECKKEQHHPHSVFMAIFRRSRGRLYWIPLLRQQTQYFLMLEYFNPTLQRSTKKLLSTEGRGKSLVFF